MLKTNKLIEYAADGTTVTSFEEFLQMEGQVAKPTADIEVFRRKGVGGIGLRDLGIKGKEFVVTTTNLVQSFQKAEDAMDRFVAMSGKYRRLVMQDIDYGNVFVLEATLDKPVIPAPIFSGVLPAQYLAGGVAGQYVIQIVDFKLGGTA